MSLKPNQKRAQEILRVTGLSCTHFADLIRVAQIIYDPNGGVSGTQRQVDWLMFGIPEAVEQNLSSLGQKYQYDSPHVEIEVVWEDLTPETRSWFIAHKSILWEIEASFPALDED